MATLSELGERKLVRMLLDFFAQEEVIGLGDDAAALPMDGHYLLLTTDVVNQQTHIPEGASAEQVGWYVVAVNFSDIAAMGGEPIGFLAALSLPRTLEVDYLQGLARGMKACAEEHDALVLGGDTKEGSEISICGTALGRTRGERVLRRTGCRPGDMVAVTGDLGQAGWALRTLTSDGPSEDVLDVLLRPRPRVAEGLILAQISEVTSCMDTSDGLASSLGQLSELNGVSFEITFEHVPSAIPLEGADETVRREALLFEGGDFELLFTVRPEGWEPLQRTLREEGFQATLIGRVGEPGPNLLVVQDERGELEARGYEHFT